MEAYGNLLAFVASLKWPFEIEQFVQLLVSFFRFRGNCYYFLQHALMNLQCWSSKSIPFIGFEKKNMSIFQPPAVLLS